MKNLTVLLLLLVLASCQSTRSIASVRQGGIDASGGNIPRSTPEAVDKLVGLLPEFFPRLVVRWEIISRQDAASRKYTEAHLPPNYPPHPPSAEDILLKKVSDAWFPADGRHALLEALKNIRFESLDTCTNAEGVTAASYLNNTICFNRQKFSQYSTEELVHQLVSLSMHEMVHHFGFGEAEARTMQKDVDESYDQFNLSLHVTVVTTQGATHWMQELAAIENELKNPSPDDLLLCGHLGSLKSESIGISDTGYTPWLRSYGSLFIQTDTFGAAGYCGIQELARQGIKQSFVKVKDLAGLRTRIQAIHKEYYDNYKDFSRFINADFNKTSLPKDGDEYAVETYLSAHGIEVHFDNQDNYGSGK